MQLIRNHINSPIDDVGTVGGFLSSNPKRIGEYNLHGDNVTKNRVCRWKREKNEKVLAKANKFYQLMKEYRNFWGY